MFALDHWPSDPMFIMRLKMLIESRKNYSRTWLVIRAPALCLMHLRGNRNWVLTPPYQNERAVVVAGDLLFDHQHCIAMYHAPQHPFSPPGITRRVSLVPIKPMGNAPQNIVAKLFRLLELQIASIAQSGSKT